MSEIKLCKDCKWCQPHICMDGSPAYSVAICKAPAGMTISPVDGAPVARDLTFCGSLRKAEFVALGTCGPSAAWFEQAPPKVEAVAIEQEPVKPWWRFW